MVKPIFQAAANIRKAETADEAFEVALLFLASSQAKEVDLSESGTFLNGAKAVFEGHEALDKYEMLLRITRTLQNPSEHMKAFAEKALTSLSRQEYLKEAIPIHLQNARVIMAAQEPSPKVYTASGYSAVSLTRLAEARYTELLKAKDFDEFTQAVSKTIREKDISGEQLPIFFESMMKGLQGLGVPVEGQIEFLDSLTVSTDNRGLSNLAHNRATTLNREEQKKAQGNLGLNGRDLSMP